MQKLRARVVYRDAITAFDMLEACEGTEEIRVHWAAALVLTRTAMDVLDKVDAETSDQLKEAVATQWNSVQKNAGGVHDVFWKFLKPERDLLIHQYELSAELAPSFLLLENGGRLQTENGEPILMEEDFFILSSGAFEGQDARDVLRDALKWVDQRIAEIEAIR